MKKLKNVITFVILITLLLTSFIYFNPQIFKKVDVVQAQTSNVTLTLANTNDAANQDGTDIDTGISGSFIGDGQYSGASYLGLRFSDASVLVGASITSASVEFRVSSSAWQPIGINIFGEENNSSENFSSGPIISERKLTDTMICYADNVSWNTSTWYGYDITEIVQELVDCCSSEYMTIILEGSMLQYARKNNLSNARLVVDYVP